MAFTVTFPTAGTVPTPRELQDWLIEKGEPYDDDGATLTLRALPLRIVHADTGLTGWIEVTARAPLSRLVDLLFALSVRAGSDVKLAGVGGVTRAALWMQLADEQDRVRLAAALERTAEHGNGDDVGQRLWALLSAIHPGRDLRWDANARRVVELVEVGQGMSVDEARWILEDARPGDVVPKPVPGPVHVIAWRFVSQCWPALCE